MTLTPPARPAPAPSSAASARLSRDDIIRLGQAGRPWDFLPIGEAALRIAPEDPGLLLLAAANFAKVGLRTAARERLAAMPAAVREDAGVKALAQVVERLADDRLSAVARIERCRGNVGVLMGRLSEDERRDVEGAMAEWEERAREEEWFCAGDENVVGRRGGAWVGLADAAGMAGAAVMPAGEAPITVEGASPPWLLRRVLREVTRRGDGFWRRVRVVEPDVMALLDGLAACDLREELGQERAQFFVGAAAGERLAAALDAAMGTQIAGPTLAWPGRGGGGGGGGVAAGVIEGATARQVQMEARLLAEVAEVYRGRGRGWWARRYAEACGGTGAPLRILIPTHRFSTFVRHSSDDIAGALRRMGCEVRVLMEPDDSSLLATVGYLAALREFQPDLVVLINYTRGNLGSVMPGGMGGEGGAGGVPVVCWIQDALAHLYREDVGRAQGELDFLVGHLHRELFTQFGYPRGRSLPTPVLASGTKFHDGPVAPGLAERMACEIAYASNQSETPEACRDRLMRESAASAVSVRAIGAIYERVREVRADTMGHRIGPRLEAAVREELERAGVAMDEKLVTHALNQWARPMADRLLRHETARWAARIAERRGWRLKLFGRGWESHPQLARFARGVLEHGEELRASYRCAAVHLHASVNWCLHQRVMECALSGGLPLCRLKRDDLSPLEAWAIRAMIERGTPAATWLPTRALLYPVADTPEAMEVCSLMGRLGLPTPHLWSVQRAWIEDPSRYDGGMPMERSAAWLLGDMAETTFWSEATLEAAVERAVQRRAWREDVVRGIAGRVREGLTYEGVMGRVVGMIREGLEGGVGKSCR